MIQEDLARIGEELREMTERGERRDAATAEQERDSTEYFGFEGKEDTLVGEHESEMHEDEWQEQERLAHVRLEREWEEEDQLSEVMRIEDEARREALEEMVREMEINRRALEQLKSQRYKEEKEKEERRRRDRERLAKSFGPELAASRPRSKTPPNPFMAQSAGGLFLDGLNLPFGNLYIDNMGGAAGFYHHNGGYIDLNSGNTITNITTNSNNDSAIRIGPGTTIPRSSFCCRQS